MLKIYVELKAKIDMPNLGWKKDEVLKMENNIFDELNGFAFHEIDKDNWEIIYAEIKEYKQINNR